jgi:hypothetical protein
VLPNIQVALGPSNAIATGDNFGNDFGDYMGLAYYGSKFVPCWTGNQKTPSSLGNPDLPNLDIYISVVTTPGGTSATVVLPDDRFEKNDTSDVATQLSLASGLKVTNLTINHHPSNGLPDYDWYSFTATKDGTFNTAITYQTVNGGGDLHMRVFTVVGQFNTLVQLGSSRLIGSTSQFVSVHASVGEKLLVEVYGFDHADGTYTFLNNLV